MNNNKSEIIKFITFLKRKGAYEKYLINFNDRNAYDFRCNLNDDYDETEFLSQPISESIYYSSAHYWYYWLSSVHKARFVDAAFCWADSNESYEFWHSIEMEWRTYR